MFILRLTGSVRTDSWGLWKGVVSDCSTQIWGKKDFLEGRKKTEQGASDLPCFSQFSLPLVWLVMCLNQGSVGLPGIFSRLNLTWRCRTGFGWALGNFLSERSWVFFFWEKKRFFSEQGNFLSAWEKISLESCWFLFYLLVTSIKLAEVKEMMINGFAISSRGRFLKCYHEMLGMWGSYYYCYYY